MYANRNECEMCGKNDENFGKKEHGQCSLCHRWNIGVNNDVAPVNRIIQDVRAIRFN